MAAAAAVQLELQQMQLYLTWASQHHPALMILPQGCGHEAAQLQWSPNPLYMAPEAVNAFAGEMDSVNNEMPPLQLHLHTRADMAAEASVSSPTAHSTPSATQVTTAATTQHTSTTAAQVSYTNPWATAAAQPLAEVPCEVPAGPAQCCEQCQAHTAQLIAALVDANARVNVARTQLLAAQADMSMLLGEDLAQIAATSLPFLA
jgi:hypothetical protein